MPARSLALFAAVLLALPLVAQTQAHLTVTVESSHNPPPLIVTDQVMVEQHGTRDRVTEFLPATGSHGDLQLFILIDDGADTSLASSWPTLRSFLDSLPPTASVGLAYLRYGSAQIVHPLSNDHAAVGKALRLPLGEPGVESALYDSMRDLIKKWPSPAAERREIVLLSSGIDMEQSGNPEDPLFLNAVSDAQRAGIVVYDIYVPSAGHLGHDYWRITNGQNHLSQLSDETGGETYFLTARGTLITPDLDQIAAALGHQYLLSFVPVPGKSSGLQPVAVHTSAGGADLHAADAVYVPVGH